jgi:hypothetical protein
MSVYLYTKYVTYVFQKYIVSLLKAQKRYMVLNNKNLQKAINKKKKKNGIVPEMPLRRLRRIYVLYLCVCILPLYAHIHTLGAVHKGRPVKYWLFYPPPPL